MKNSKKIHKIKFAKNKKKIQILRTFPRCWNTIFFDYLFFPPKQKCHYAAKGTKKNLTYYPCRVMLQFFIIIFS